MSDISVIERAMQNSKAHIYLWESSVDIVIGAKHTVHGGITDYANIESCPRCDGYWHNHAQGMMQCSTHACHTWKQSNLKQISANLNIPATSQDVIGDKRVSEIFSDWIEYEVKLSQIIEGDDALEFVAEDYDCDDEVIFIAG